MLSERPWTNVPYVLKAIGIILFGFLVIVTAVGSRSSDGQAISPKHRMSGAPTFSVDFDEPVAMRIAASAHYAIDTIEAAEEWAKLLPPSGYLVHLPSPSSATSDNSTLKPYTVTLFHQLKCLDIIRQEYLLDPPAIVAKRTEHCMNYLRQTVLCRPNLWLESAKNTVGTASRAYDMVCRDWEAVYREAEKNHEDIVKFRSDYGHTTEQQQ